MCRDYKFERDLEIVRRKESLESKKKDKKAEISKIDQLIRDLLKESDKLIKLSKVTRILEEKNEIINLTKKYQDLAIKVKVAIDQNLIDKYNLIADLSDDDFCKKIENRERFYDKSGVEYKNFKVFVNQLKGFLNNKTHALQQNLIQDTHINRLSECVEDCSLNK